MKPHAPIPAETLAKLVALAEIIRNPKDERAWDAASAEFDLLMTTAVRVNLVEEVAGLRAKPNAVVVRVERMPFQFDGVE